MKYNTYIKLLLLLLVVFTRCKDRTIKGENIKSNNLETILLDISKSKGLVKEGNFKDYFKSYDLIPLETNPESIITKLSRIYFFNKRIFILDKETNQLFIFNEQGKFLNKINNRGKGPNEYVGLADFTINEDTNEIIIYSYFPKKMLVYNLEGKFIRQYQQSKKEKEYRNIAYIGRKFLLLSDLIEYGKPFLIEKSIDLENEKTLLKARAKDKYLELVSFGVPNIIKSKSGLYTSFVYSDTIYKYNETSGFEAKYYIDFGTKKTPIHEYKEQKHDFFWNPENSKKYGFGISDFRETNNFIVFKYHGYKLIIYSKKDKTIHEIPDFYEDYILFSNYMAHDGEDNKIVSIVDAELLSSKMKFFEKNKDKWNQIPDKIKEIFENTSATDNPLLLVYEFK